MAIVVHRPGMMTTVQDLGRWGWLSAGVPVAGPMDWYSHRLANRLVGNDADAATLEITLIGPDLELTVPTVVAVTGARFAVAVDDGGDILEPDRARALRGGARLRFGRRTAGARAYLAVGGGIDVPRVLGSRATHVVSGMGGHEGRCLRAGDRLPIGVGGAPPLPAPSPAPLSLPLPVGGARLRIVEGPHARSGDTDAWRHLVTTRFRVSARSDRMGYRLEGGRVEVGEADLLSDATVAGGIQVPASGEPILLMSDRQTTGGYPQLATVVTADLPLAGQLAPGDWVEFEPCDRDRAIAALRERVTAIEETA